MISSQIENNFFNHNNSRYLKRKKATVITNLYDSLTNKRDEAMRKTREAKSLLVSIKDDISDLKYRTQLKDVGFVEPFHNIDYNIFAGGMANGLGRVSYAKMYIQCQPND